MPAQPWKKCIVLAAGSIVLLAACTSPDSGADGSSSAALTEGVLTTESSPTIDPGQPGTLKIVLDSELDSSGTLVESPIAPADPADPAGDGKASCSGQSIAVVGSFTGVDEAVAQNVLRGATLAIDTHNTANSGCHVEAKEFDLGADPSQTAAIAQQIVDDPSIVGVVGPTFSSELTVTGPTFNAAGLAILSPSATSANLAKNGWTTFFRGVANDTVQGTALGHYLATTGNYFKVCVLSDDSDYGTALATQVTAGLAGSAAPECSTTIPVADSDTKTVTEKINAESPDAVYYAGFYPQSAALLQQLRDTGVTAAFVSSDGTNVQEFVDLIDTTANGTTLSCGCAPAPTEFTDAYRAAVNEDPGAYSAESYDLATILLKGIDSGKVDRPAIAEYVRAYEGQGLARTYKWDAQGELSSPPIWIYKVQ